MTQFKMRYVIIAKFGNVSLSNEDTDLRNSQQDIEFLMTVGFSIIALM